MQQMPTVLTDYWIIAAECQVSIVAWPSAAMRACIPCIAPCASSLQVQELLYHSGKPWAATVYPGAVVNHWGEPDMPCAGTTVRTGGGMYHGSGSCTVVVEVAAEQGGQMNEPIQRICLVTKVSASKR